MIKRASVENCAGFRFPIALLLLSKFAFHEAAFYGCSDESKNELAAEERELGRAISRLEQSCSSPSPPSKVYFSLLKSCYKHRNLDYVRRILSHLASHKYLLSGLLGENLVITLAKCGDVESALHVFYQLQYRTTFSWTAIISGLLDSGRSKDALTMYLYMQQEGVEPDNYTFVSLLKACGNISNLDLGQALHDNIQSRSLACDVFIGTTLISMYGKCGASLEAENVFLKLPAKNLVTWNSMLSAYVEGGQAERALHLYRQMLDECMTRNPETLLIAIQACNLLASKNDSELHQENKVIALEIGHTLHSEARRMNFIQDSHIGNTLLSLYGRCNSVTKGENVFSCLSGYEVISWTALISMYVECSQGTKALHAYTKMQMEGVSPNQQTVVSALQACCVLKHEGDIFEEQSSSLEIGRALHEDAQRSFTDLDTFVCTTLIGLYAKCGEILEAENVFCVLAHHTVVQWNGMLSAYVEQGQGRKALHCYRQLCDSGLHPDQGTFIIALQACNILLEEMEDASFIEQYGAKYNVHGVGQALHADAKKAGLASDVVVGTGLITMYSKCGTIREAETTFAGLSKHNMVAWNAMLSAYVNQGQGIKALCLYIHLKRTLPLLNFVTIICILQACSGVGSLENCWQLHFAALTAGHDAEGFLASTLIHTYGNCGDTEDALAVLSGLTRPIIASWNSCIAGYGAVGNALSSWHLFEESQLTCNEATHATFTSLLAACSHGGLVDEGISVFKYMKEEFLLKPFTNQYVTLIDLIGRSGNFSMTEEVIYNVPDNCSLSFWMCLLSACCLHGNSELGELAFNHAINLQSEEPTPYVLMANLCYRKMAFNESHAAGH
ncbi:hypothetical protein KP509_21G089400 [Ceratopteris richardii]|uniref:Pentatricopeptide repeat-containing protein n=1 Tax=Ceratopteris richardii TaxID=49495 RepID=A0A8T2SEE1_CERRI|nr:hypothetical protein KP509_21G089400 [Ceratopteris richardii]